MVMATGPARIVFTRRGICEDDDPYEDEGGCFHCMLFSGTLENAHGRSACHREMAAVCDPNMLCAALLPQPPMRMCSDCVTFVLCASTLLLSFASYKREARLERVRARARRKSGYQKISRQTRASERAKLSSLTNLSLQPKLFMPHTLRRESLHPHREASRAGFDIIKNIH